MNVPMLALLGHALRQDVRLLRPHLVRLLLAVFLLAAMIAAHATSTAFGAPGLQFFALIAALNFACITLAAAGYFSTAITEEKEEETLGLLKMAGIGDGALLLGKSTSRMISVALILAVQLPFTLLAVTLGGVTLGQVFAVYAALLAYLVFAANLGLLCSVLCATSAGAALLTTMLLGLLLGVGPLTTAVAAATGAQLAGGPVVIVDALDAASIWKRLQTILSAGFSGGLWSTQIASNLLTGLGLFVVSWALFERLTRDRRPVLERWRQRVFRRVAPQRRSRRVRGNPFVWKEFAFGVGGWRGMTVRLALYVAVFPVTVAAYQFFVSRMWRGLSVESNLILDLLMVAAVDLAFQAARVLRSEVRQRTLPTLALLPQSLGRIGALKVAGCLLAVAPALLVYIICLALSSGDDLNPFTAEHFATREAWLLLTQFFVLFALTMRLSLTVRWGALPLAVGIVYVLLPAVGALLMMPFLGAAGGIGSAIRICELIVGPLDVVAAFLVVLLSYSTVRRLTRLAAE